MNNFKSNHELHALIISPITFYVLNKFIANKFITVGSTLLITYVAYSHMKKNIDQ